MMMPPDRPKIDDLEKAWREGANVMAYIPLADELRRRRQYGRALAVVQEGMTAGAQSPRAMTVLGNIYYDMGQFEQAVETLRRAAALAPGNFEANLLLASALTRQRDFVEARTCLEPLLASHPGNSELQLLDRVIRAEISQSITELNEIAVATREYETDEHMRHLWREIEDLPGVDAVFEFGIRAEGGDIYFEEEQGDILDDDIKVTLIECSRLTTKLDYGMPRQALLETGSGRFFFRLRKERGLLALAAPNVKLGRLRFLMDQYLQLHGVWAAKS